MPSVSESPVPPTYMLSLATEQTRPVKTICIPRGNNCAAGETKETSRQADTTERLIMPRSVSELEGDSDSIYLFVDLFKVLMQQFMLRLTWTKQPIVFKASLHDHMRDLPHTTTVPPENCNNEESCNLPSFSDLVTLTGYTEDDRDRDWT